MFIGQGGTGTYNDANTAATGGALTGFGTGTGSMSFGRIYVGQLGGTGTFNINTSGTVTMNSDFTVGINAGSTGAVKMDAGTLNRTGGSTTFIGQAGGNGTFNMSGGTVTSSQDTLVGVDAGSVGALKISNGSYGVAGQLQIGRNQGTGTVSVANTATTGGVLTGFGLGSGSMTIGNRLYVGGFSNGTNQLGTGTMNINTTGTIAVGNDLALGTGGGTGVVNMDLGTLTTGGWNFIGKDENGSGGSGIVKIGGGLINNGAGRTYVGYGNSRGQIIMSGGEYRNLGDFMVVGHNNLANATASSISMTGGTINANLFSIGGDQDNAGKGTVTVNGAGALLNANGEIWVGNQATSTGTLTVSAGTVQSASWFAIGRAGSTGVLTINGTGVVQKTSATGILELGNNGSSNATVNLDGGFLKVNRVGTGGGASTFNFNGGTLAATVSEPLFMQGLTNAFVKAGGAVIDTQGFSATIAQSLVTDAVSLGGGLAKTGAGTLTLSATGNSYTGATTITNGTLSIGTLANGGAPSTLGASSSAAANLVFNGGALQYTGGSTSTNRSFTANAGKSATFDVNTASTTLTFTGGGMGAGGLTKIGNGTLVLADGANYSYSGATNANGGVLAASGTYSSGFALGAGGHLTAVNLTEGTLTVPTLALNTGGNVDFEFGGAPTLNAGHDIINISTVSGLTLGSTGLYLYQTGGTTAFTTNGTYTLFDYNTAFNNALTGAFTIANSQVGKLYSITNNTGATTIELSIADTVITSWATDGGGLWSAGANWTMGVPNSFGAIATFGSVLTAANAPATVTVDGGKTVGVIIFDNPNSYILSGSTITLDNGSGTPLISVAINSGLQTIAAPLSLVAATNVAPFAGTTLAISGNISGARNLSVTDAGTVVLTGTNSYASTSVTTGFLKVGDGGTTGSLGTGPVTLGTGTLLTINRSNANAIANNISGAGSLAQTGAGTLTYSGTATHTGTTVLSAGTFISDGTINGTSSLDIENTATLRNSSTTTVAGPLLIANNAATLASLDVQNSATATVTGATTVAGGAGSTGSLNVSGSASFTTAGITVGNNGGSGALNISGATMNGGGTNIGGNSTGTLNMTGGTLSTTTFHVGQNTGGDGTVNMTAGTITTNTWGVVGQGGGSTGLFNMSGGTWNQNHTDFLTVGENSSGSFNMSGASVLNNTVAVDTANRNTNKGNIIVGRNNGGGGVWNLSDTATAHIRELRVGDNAGSNGTVNIGGTAFVDSSYDFHIGRAGLGVVNLSGGQLNTVSGWMQLGIETGSSGTLNVAAGSVSAREYQVGVNGTGAVIVSGGTVTATQLFSLGENAVGTGSLTASGTGVANLTNSLDVGRNGFGLANISGTALVTITNGFSVGNFGASQGYMFQTGGTVNPAGGADWRIGGAAYSNNPADITPAVITAAAAAVGIYNLSGGAFNTNHNFQIGAYGTGLMSVSGTGIATISGGFPAVGRFAGSFGVLDVSGGNFNVNSGTLLIVGEDGTGTLNVRGGTVTQSTVNTVNAVSIGHTATGNGTLNLLAGTLNTLSVGTNNATGISTLNFNGGRLQANGSNATFVQGLTKAYVYSGGGTVDTQTNSVTIAQSLLAPTGSGVTGVPVNTGGAGYQSAPIVKITGGGGTGATAIATLDNAGLVSAIIITNPGVDYTSAPTVTLVGGAPTTAAALAPATFAANTAGGLTKISNGTLALTGVNGFNGATINGGILNANADAALGVSTGSVTISNGATLQAGGTLTTAARTITLGTGGGQIDTNGNPVTLAFGSTVTGTTLTKLGAGTLTLAGTQTYATLNANGGVTNLNKPLGTGTSTINASATVNINASQTLAALNIVDGVEVTFGDGLSFAGEPEKFGAPALVPEPGSLALLMVGALGVLGRRRRSAQVR